MYTHLIGCTAYPTCMPTICLPQTCPPQGAAQAVPNPTTGWCYCNTGTCHHQGAQAQVGPTGWQTCACPPPGGAQAQGTTMATVCTQFPPTCPPPITHVPPCPPPGGTEATVCTQFPPQCPTHPMGCTGWHTCGCPQPGAEAQVGPTGWLTCTQPPNCVGPTGWLTCACPPPPGGAQAQAATGVVTVCCTPVPTTCCTNIPPIC